MVTSASSNCNSSLPDLSPERWKYLQEVYGTTDRKKIVKLLEEKKHYRDEAEAMMRSTGNLSDSEITELLVLEFGTDEETEHKQRDIATQIRRYYLQLKNINLQAAEQMKIDVTPMLEYGISTLGDIKKLCIAVYKYLSGFVIDQGSKWYSIHNGKFLINGKPESTADRS